MTARHAIAAPSEQQLALASVRDVVMGHAATHTLGNREALLRAYEEFIPELEEHLWRSGCDTVLLERYQAAHRQMEQLLAGQEDDPRHKIMVVLSVADRPQLLEDCLASLVQLCELFQYGGKRNGRYPKVAMFIADDSRDEACIARHRELASGCALQGIETHYFGAHEQLACLDALPAETQQRLQRIIGTHDRNAFYHKGASAMRNISYLKLHELVQSESGPLLFHFIDSDQEFRVKIATPAGDRDLYALNYFHALERLFSRSDALVVTGKVVGDPPVSPSVMASGFLDDVIAFVHEIAATEPDGACCFHAAPTAHAEAAAAYHDMPELFGFAPVHSSFAYACDLAAPHTNGDCLDHFAACLNRFFYGEHPTRKTRYGYAGPGLGVTPARTVYSGNYIVRSEGLRYFLPFAPLRLRMPGPTLGRILQSELGTRFVTANLPMLHQRTVGTRGEMEFRPGIDAARERVDISGEFVRQFYGDVMLFSIEKLAAMGYPEAVPEMAIVEVLEITRTMLLEGYNKRQQAIGQKLVLLKEQVDTADVRWKASANHRSAALRQLEAFIADIDHNFGRSSTAYAAINDANVWLRKRAELAGAIAAYGEDRACWDGLLFGEQIIP